MSEISPKKAVLADSQPDTVWGLTSTSPPARSGGRSISVLVLTMFIAALAAALFFGVLRHHPIPATELKLPWLALAGVFICAELLFVSLRTRRSAHCVSLSEVPLVLGLITQTPVALVGARLAGSVFGLVLTHRGRGIRLLFNLALHALEACLAATVFLLVIGASSPLSPRGWLAGLAAVLISDAVSGVLVILVIVTHDDDREEWRRLPRDLMRGSVVAATNTCVALIAALAINQTVFALLPLALAAVVAYLAYRRYVTRSEAASRVERLYDFTRQLSGTINMADIVPLTLSHVRDETRAKSAHLIIPTTSPSISEETTQPMVRSAHLRDVVTEQARAGAHYSATGSTAATVVPLPEIRRWSLSDQGNREEVVTDLNQWWRHALSGFPVLLTAHSGHTRAPNQPRDGMAVPLVLDDGKVAVLAVERSLPDVGTFSRDDLRLFQAMANHAAVALGKARLVERLRRQANEQEQIALHDSLTDLPNRRYFTSLLSSVLEDEHSDVAVLLLDLNGFKDVNDTLGHDIGDELLQEIGARLTSWLRGRGLVSRLGGDEFAVLLSGVSGSDEACAVAEELARCIAVPFRLDQLTLEVRVSVGVALASEHGREARTLLQRADVAMYAAKGRDPDVALYQAENDHNSRRRLTLLSSLRPAIESGEIFLHYQPQVSPATLTVGAMEALVRWDHPELGLIEPDEFVTLAEHSGLIRQFTLYVIESALHQVSLWRRRGLNWPVAVNVSTRNLLDARLPTDITRLLTQLDLPASALTLEITESSIMADRAGETLQRIADLGVDVSVDDFGTGYSSLGYLQRLPVHEIKVDQSFIQALMSSREDRSIVRAIVHLGHELGLRVVAEGVEDTETLHFLHNLGCDLVQGYVFAPPMSPDEVERWVMDRPQQRHLAALTDGSYHSA